MKLIFLGSTGYHANNRRHTACLAIPALGLVLDAGTGFFRLREHLCTPTLDIFLTHVHLDHCVGLTFLFDVLAGRNLDRVTVHGEADKLAAVREHLLNPLLFPVALPCDFQVLDGRQTLADGATISHFGLLHPGGAVGYRIDWPHYSLAYVSDTTAKPQADYLPHIQGVDLLIHECNYPDGMEEMAEITGHSCISPVARVARDARVGRLILTHLNPASDDADPVGLADARAIFPATDLAEDGLVIEIGG